MAYKTTVWISPTMLPFRHDYEFLSTKSMDSGLLEILHNFIHLTRFINHIFLITIQLLHYWFGNVGVKALKFYESVSDESQWKSCSGDIIFSFLLYSSMTSRIGFEFHLNQFGLVFVLESQRRKCGSELYVEECSCFEEVSLCKTLPKTS